MTTEIRLSDMEKDALTEMANIGAGNSTKPLSNILDSKIRLSLGSIDIVSLENNEKKTQASGESAVGLHTPILGAMSGHVVIMFAADNVEALSNLLRGKAQKAGSSMSDKEFLIEIGSILANSYTYALNQFLTLDIKCGKTNLIATSGESVIDIIYPELRKVVSAALLITTNFQIEKSNLQGNFALLLAIPSMESLLGKIRSMS